MPKPSELCYRALAFDEDEEYIAYITAATKDILTDTSNYVSRNNRGVAYRELGRIQDALDDFTVACEMAPQENVPFLNRAALLEQMGDLEGALTAVTEAVHIAPDDYSCYFVRADIYQELGHWQLAQEDRRNGNKIRLLSDLNAIDSQR